MLLEDHSFREECHFSAGEEIGKKAGEAKDTVVHTAEHTADKFAKGAHDAKNSVAEAAGNAKDKLGKGAEHVKDGIGNGRCNLDN